MLTWSVVGWGLAAVPLLVLLAPIGGLSAGEEVGLPPPSERGKVSVEEALKSRRTRRSFKTTALSLQQLAQLLWAAYGVTAERYGYHLKTAPSAGALYPIDVYAVIGRGGVEGLKSGVYHYRPAAHALRPIKAGETRPALAEAALGQAWMAEAPVMLVVTGQYARCTIKYGRRGVVYTHLEAGSVGQNIFLQAEALGLGAGIVGAFDNRRVIEVMGLPDEHDPLLIMPVGLPER